MEYKITLTTPVSHEDIVTAVRQWLRCTDVGQPMGGTNALFPQPWGRSGSPAANPFGLNRAGSGFGSSSPGPSAFSTALLASPTHNIFSSHYLQTRGEVTIGPNVTLQQMSEMGRRQTHYFVVNDREMLVVEQNSLHHQWVRLPASWNQAVSNPTVSTPVSYRTAAGTGAPLDVARMTEGQKLWEAIERGTAQLPAQSAELIKSIFTPQGIALILVIAAVVALGGEFVALGVILFGVGMGLWDLVTNVFGLVRNFYQTAVNARTEQELDQAGRYLAEALLAGGLDVLDIFCAPAALGRLRVLARGRTITPRVVWAYLEERYRLLTARRATSGRVLRQADPPPSGTMTNAQKGVYGEHVSDVHMANQGHTKLNDGGTITSSTGAARGTGIDGVWRNANPPPEYIITEAKYGSSQLGDTADGRQMSDSWIRGNNRLDRAVGRQEAERIRDAMNRGQVERQLHRVDENGNITIQILDEDGNVVR